MIFDLNLILLQDFGDKFGKLFTKIDSKSGAFENAIREISARKLCKRLR